MHSAALLLEMASSKRMASLPTRQARTRKGNTASIASIVSKVLERRIEHKTISQTVVGTSVLTAGTVATITNPIVEGDDINQRSGTTIRLNRIRVLYRGTAVTTSSSLRFILFRDMMNQGTTPAPTDVLPAGNWISHYSDTREVQQKRFHIIHDVTMDLPIAGENVKTLVFNIPLNGVVYYNGATNVASANGKGALFLLVIGNAITTAYDYDTQLVYTDA